MRNKIKIIELFYKIANNEEVPKKFTYKGYLWEYDVKNKMWFYYFGESKSHRFDRLFYLNMILNDEVEILDDAEEKEDKDIPLIPDDELNEFNMKDRKLDLDKLNYNFLVLKEKINQVVEELNKRQ